MVIYREQQAKIIYTNSVQPLGQGPSDSLLLSSAFSHLASDHPALLHNRKQQKHISADASSTDSTQPCNNGDIHPPSREQEQQHTTTTVLQPI